jgi:3-oxoacyl-[acyl-carrier-protein] synthase-3
MQDAYINGIGVVLGQVGPKPSRSKDRVLEANGIEQRYYAIDPHTGERTHTNARLTADAVRDLLARTSFPPEELDLLACGTSSPDQWIPNHALMVQGELALRPCEVVSMMGVCCSGISAMKYGFMAIRSGAARNAVATGSELVSSQLSASYFRRHSTDGKLPFDKDFLRWMLSDGAGAALLQEHPREDGQALKIEWIESIAYANELEACMYAGALKEADGSLRGWREIEDREELRRHGFLDLRQDPRLLRSNVIPRGVRDAWPAVRARTGLDPDDITWFVPHYSSAAFRQELHDALIEIDCAIPFERWFTNLAQTGNMGAASSYVMLEELVSSGRLRSGDTILCMVPESARFTYSFVYMTAV